MIVRGRGRGSEVTAWGGWGDSLRGRGSGVIVWGRGRGSEVTAWGGWGDSLRGRGRGEWGDRQSGGRGKGGVTVWGEGEGGVIVWGGQPGGRGEGRGDSLGGVG